MFCKIISAAVSGIDVCLVSVEADVRNGFPSFSMVGLLSSEVKEARERVRTAINNSAIDIPPKRITINLSPADIRKEGSRFDLPIAISLLCCLGYLSYESVKDIMIVGELSLDGTINKINGVLPIAMLTKEVGFKKLIVPLENAKEGAVINGVEVIGVINLKHVIELLNNSELMESEFVDIENLLNVENNYLDYSDVYGQEGAKRATEIAVAGMHNLLYIGSPGSGKTMMASRMPSILPKLSFDEAIEISKIYSALGLLTSKPIINHHPFRAPHHTITPQALVGGGKNPKPGEITLAHKGVLFLDELPEYSRKAIETLRQPMEEHKITINRENASYEFPADFMFVAAMNPCACGFHPDKHKCNCTQYELNRYLCKVKGALLDRIDMCVHTPRIDIVQLQSNVKTESSKEIKQRIEYARLIQSKRYEDSTICFNSRLGVSDIDKYCKLGNNELKLLADCYNKLELSSRVYHKIIKVARTIADLDGDEHILRKHLLEALAYRNILLQY